MCLFTFINQLMYCFGLQSFTKFECTLLCMMFESILICPTHFHILVIDMYDLDQQYIYIYISSHCQSNEVQSLNDFRFSCECSELVIRGVLLTCKWVLIVQ